MAKFLYLVSCADEQLWVANGHFELLGHSDSPHNYEPVSSLTKAKEEVIRKRLIGAKDLKVYKFDAKPPYKYHGRV